MPWPLAVDFQQCYLTTFAVCPVPLTEQGDHAMLILPELFPKMPVTEQIQLLTWIETLSASVQASTFEGWRGLANATLCSTTCTDSEINQLLKWFTVHARQYYTALPTMLLYLQNRHIDWLAVRQLLQPLTVPELPLHWPTPWRMHQLHFNINSITEFQQLRLQLALLLRCDQCRDLGCLADNLQRRCHDCPCCKHVFDEPYCRHGA